MTRDSLYKRGVVQLHDQGIAQRMQELSGDPSALMPPSVDVASPLAPVADLTRYQERSLLLHGPSFGGTSSGAYQFNVDMNVVNAPRAIGLESVQWTEAYTGVSHTTWVELMFGISLAGSVFAVPMMAYLATLSGVARDVQIIAQPERLSHAIFDKPLVYSQSTSQEVGDSFGITAITMQWDRVGGSGIISFEDLLVCLKLYY